MVRMAYLAIVGSYSVNGVAELHSKLLQQGLLKDFAEFWPVKFNNKTNGVTQRRWLAACNPGLNDLISSKIGSGWVTNLEELAGLREYADDRDFQQAWRHVKAANKVQLARLIRERTWISVDPAMLFDVQVKRIHEYKRQLLNLLHAVHLYDRIRRGQGDGLVPRVIIFGGKAAPGYVMAKNVIKCINNVAGVINADPAMEGRLQVVFFPDYNVTAMETICPATDLSEQISTAGKEASCTGNMKFMMNGALDAVVHSVQNPSDPWMTAADFRSFVDTQTEASKVFRDVERWTRMSILNTAASGRFSTDRTIRDYNEDIWNLEPIQPV